MSSKLMADWDTHHDSIKELYIDQDMGLPKLRAEMEKMHGFKASKNQYQRQFKKWQWRKNLTEEEWKYTGKTLKKREAECKESDVLFNGVKISEEKVKKETSRHFLQPYHKTPPASQCLVIQTPRPSQAIEPEEQVIQVDQIMENRKRQRSEHPEEQISSKMICNTRQRDKIRQNHLVNYRPRVSPPIKNSKLPYLEFVDYITELKFEINSQPLLQGEFFDSPSPCILPTTFSQECNDSYWSLNDDYDGILSASVSEDSLTQGNGKFYESFANLLIDPRRGTKEDDFDRHDANLELQKNLPGLLANMPEKNPGEIESIINTLLGPPQFSAGICLLQVVVYLYSNNNLTVDSSNMVMKWIVAKIPLSNLITILKTKLPTLQEFQSRLLLFAIKNDLIAIVKELMGLDSWMREMALSQEYLFASIKSQENLAMTELILSSSSEDVKKIVFNSVHYRHMNWWSIGKHISIEAAQLLHHEGINLSTKGMRGDTLLDYAISRGDINLARYLISIGVGCPTRGKKKRINHLVFAVWCDQVDMVRVFLENDFPVDGMIEWNFNHYAIVDRIELSVPKFPATAIQAAAFIGNIDIVKELVQAGANVNEPACGLDGMTALQAAVEFNNITVVEFLLQNGAAVNAQGNTFTGQPRTALLAAIENNNVPIFDILLKHGANSNVPVISKYGTTILGVASVQKESSIFVPTLLARGAVDKFKLDPQLKARSMILQLERAVFENDLTAVQDLIESGVAVDMRLIKLRWSTHPGVRYTSWKEGILGEDTTTILHSALKTMQCHKTSDSSIFRYLIKHIADINEQTYDEKTPILHEVVDSGDLGLVNVLLDAGANIDFVWNCFGRTRSTALMTAICKRNLDMVVLLLERGADINLAYKQHANSDFVESPLQLSALMTIEPDITKLLLSQGADIKTNRRNCENSFYGIAVRRANHSPFYMSVVRELLPKVDIQEIEIGFWCAAVIGDLILVKLFLDSGADINTIQLSGFRMENTALGIAAMHGHIKIAEFLLSQGADVNLRIESRYTPETALACAAAGGKLDMVQLLINNGADTDLPLVDRYHSALKRAKKMHHYGIVMILEKYIKEAWEEWNQLRMLEMI